MAFHELCNTGHIDRIMLGVNGNDDVVGAPQASEAVGAEAEEGASCDGIMINYISFIHWFSQALIGRRYRSTFKFATTSVLVVMLSVLPVVLVVVLVVVLPRFISLFFFRAIRLIMQVLHVLCDVCDLDKMFFLSSWALWDANTTSLQTRQHNVRMRSNRL